MGTFVYNPLSMTFDIVGSGSAGPAGPQGPAGPAGPSGADGAPGVPGYSPNYVVSGGNPVWTGGLNFTISAAVYYIGGVKYTAPQTNVTLAAADPTNDRIDMFIADTTGTISVLTGTPGGPPVAPTIDPSSQIMLTSSGAYVAANATVPSNIVTTEDIYHENVEYTTAVTTHVNAADTTNPHSGTKDIQFSGAVSGNKITLTKGSAINLANSTNLVFWIYPNSVWPSTRSLSIQWFNTNTAVGSIVTFREAQFGFTSSKAAYQQIVIPLSLFAANGLTINRLQIMVAGSGTMPIFYIDDIILQTGITSGSAPSAMTWSGGTGAWNSSTSYAVNNVVIYNGRIWLALAANVNSAPALGNANWTILADVSIPASMSAYQYLTNGVGPLSSSTPSGMTSDLTYGNFRVDANVQNGIFAVLKAVSGGGNTWSISACVDYVCTGGVNSIGLCVYQPTGNKLYYFYFSPNNFTLFLVPYTAGSAGATILSLPAYGNPVPRWLKAYADGTNIYFQWSADGLHWFTFNLTTITLASFIGSGLYYGVELNATSSGANYSLQVQVNNLITTP